MKSRYASENWDINIFYELITSRHPKIVEKRQGTANGNALFCPKTLLNMKDINLIPESRKKQKLII